MNEETMYTLATVFAHHLPPAELTCFALSTKAVYDCFREKLMHGSDFTFLRSCAHNIRKVVKGRERQNALLSVLFHNVVVYARKKDADGGKIDNSLNLYSCSVVDFGTGSYRYNNGVTTVGEYAADSVSPSRVFVVLPEVERNALRERRLRGSPTGKDDGSDPFCTEAQEVTLLSFTVFLRGREALYERVFLSLDS
jgi:hypothetical protein